MMDELKYQHRYDSEQSESGQPDRDSRNQGMWLQDQLLKYMVFCSFNAPVLTSKLQRRTAKIFMEMARFIGTRCSTQCRSQNQKLIKKHKNMRKMLRAYELRIGKQKFQKACTQSRQQLKAMRQSRKRHKAKNSQNSKSVLVQTEFSSESESSENCEIKVEDQQACVSDYPVGGFISQLGMTVSKDGTPEKKAE